MFSRSPEKRGEIIAQLICRKYKASMASQINMLLADGAVLPAHYKGDGVLAAAIHHQHKKLVEACLVQGLGVTGPAYRFSTPLKIALDQEDLDLCVTLIERGADQDTCDSHGCNILMRALIAGQFALAKELHAKGVSTAPTNNGYTCLHAALASGKPHILRYVLDYMGQDVNAGTSKQAMQIKVVATKSWEIYQMMRDAGMREDPTVKYNNGYYSYSLSSYAQSLGVEPELLAHLEKIEADHLQAVKEQELQARTGWRLTGPHEVAMLSETDGLPYQVTEIFNFQSGIYTRINRNAETKVESASSLDMAQFSQTGMIDAAREKLQDMGGSLPAVAGKTALSGLTRNGK